MLVRLRLRLFINNNLTFFFNVYLCKHRKTVNSCSVGFCGYFNTGSYMLCIKLSLDEMGHYLRVTIYGTSLFVHVLCGFSKFLPLNRLFHFNLDYSRVLWRITALFYGACCTKRKVWLISWGSNRIIQIPHCMTQCYGSLFSNYAIPPIPSMVTTFMSFCFFFNYHYVSWYWTRQYVGNRAFSSVLFTPSEDVKGRLIIEKAEGGEGMSWTPWWMSMHAHFAVPELVEHITDVLKQLCYQSCSWHGLLWQRNKFPVITHIPAWVRHDWANR